MKSPHLIHAGLLLALLTLPSFTRELQLWPLYLLVPLALYALIVAVVPPLRSSVHWLRLGRFDGAVLAWTAAIILGASAALVLWFVLARPDVSALTQKIPHVGPMPLLLIGVTFSLTNAILEEAIFRGVFQEAYRGMGTTVGHWYSGSAIRGDSHPRIPAWAGRNGYGVGLRRCARMVAAAVGRHGGRVRCTCLRGRNHFLAFGLRGRVNRPDFDEALATEQTPPG